jgi:hypothetical protein
MILGAAVLLLSVAGVPGQQPALSDEERQIIQAREDIRMLAAKSPPAEAQEMHRNTLLRLRGTLRDLLLMKKGALTKDIRDLGASGSPTTQEYVRELQRILQSVDGEIQGLGANFALNPPANPPEPAGDPAPAEAPTPEPTPTDAQREFEETVSSFTPEVLREAAGPPEVMETKATELNCAGLVADPNPGRFPIYEQSVCFLASKIIRRRTDGETPNIRLARDKGNILPILIAKLLKTESDESLVSFITEAQDQRTDQQIGAPPSSSGTTSLVSKGGIPYALGFAVENGAAVETISGTTVTFQINPGGLLNLANDKGFITGFRESEDDPVMKFLRKSAVGLTFDTDRGDQPGVFTGDKQQLSGFSFRYEFVNDRDPRLQKYEADWERLVATVGEEFADTTWATTEAIQNLGTRARPVPTFKEPALQAWLEQTNGLLADAATIEQAAQIIRSQADLIPVELVSEETVSAVEKFAQGFQQYEEAKNRLLDKIARGKILTFEYVNRREINAPDTSNFNFIAATGTGRRVSLTANGSITIFHKRPVPLTLTDPRLGRVRDFQFAGQVDIPFSVGDLGQFDFWFSGRYERLMEDASTQVGTIIPNTKGDIAVGQFGLNIPIKGLGMKFPISFTFANRTELIKEKEVRGNFGFTFNLDTLLSKFNPF